MIEHHEEKSDNSLSKPLALFFIVMLLLNPFLAPLLAVLLKKNIEPPITVLDDETSEEPDIPWDFFQSIDRTLSFPMASAESLSQSPFYKLYPEFLRGTTEHPKAIADAMDANMKIIAPPIISFLEKNKREKVVVLGIAENHDHIGLLTTNIFAAVNAWKEKHPNTNITVIREVWNPSPDFDQRVNQAFTYFHTPNADEGSTEYKNELDTLLSHYCFNAEGIHGACATFSAKARQFDFTFTTTRVDQTPEQERKLNALNAIANRYKHPTGDIRCLDITKTNMEQVTSDDQFPHETKIIDRRITKTMRDIMRAHAYTHSHQQLIIVAWFGSTHAFTVSNMLNTTKIPHQLLNMAFDSARTVIETKKRYATNCILPKDECPPQVLKRYSEHAKSTKEAPTFRHCVLPIPYDEKHCDRVLHELNTFFVQRATFSLNIPHQIPPLLPLELPKSFSGRKISYFFATENSVKIVRQEIAKRKIEQDRARQRVEL